MPSLPLAILYQDEDLLAVNKPQGIVIHHGLPQEDVTLIDLLQDQIGGTIYPIHRLDRATSGVIVFARERAASAALNQAFSDRLVTKEYLAIVHNGIDESGQIEQPLSRSARHHRQPKGLLLPALTTYQRIAITEEAALLQVSPHTGRQHQIRRHLQSIKAPIWGDRRYGHKRHNRNMRIEIQLHRLALHAYRLIIPHPVHQTPLEIIAPLPRDLALPMQKMGFSLEALGLAWEDVADQ